ncbi:hypothetical protein NQ318_012149, partial [Aromia moschata]
LTIRCPSFLLIPVSFLIFYTKKFNLVTLAKLNPLCGSFKIHTILRRYVVDKAYKLQTYGGYMQKFLVIRIRIVISIKVKPSFYIDPVHAVNIIFSNNFKNKDLLHELGHYKTKV